MDVGNTFAKSLRVQLVHYLDSAELLTWYGMGSFFDPRQKDLDKIFAAIWQAKYPRPRLDELRLAFADFPAFKRALHEKVLGLATAQVDANDVRRVSTNS